MRRLSPARREHTTLAPEATGFPGTRDCPERGGKRTWGTRPTIERRGAVPESEAAGFPGARDRPERGGKRTWGTRPTIEGQGRVPGKAAWIRPT